MDQHQPEHVSSAQQPSENSQVIPKPSTSAHKAHADIQQQNSAEPDHTPSTQSAAITAPSDPVIPHPAESSSQPHLTPLLSSRPAPPSPASSRPSSTLISPDPSCISLVTAAGGSGTGRDRSGSNSSRGGSGGRRVSSASSAGRASLRPRPRSTLGTSFSLPETEDVTPEEPSTNEIQPVDAAVEGLPKTIPETDSPLEEIKPASKGIAIVIRDFAFLSSDERHHGRGAPIEKEDRDSGGGFKWSWRGSSESDDGAGEGSKKGWGGFGLLGGWRGFGRRGETSGSGTGEEEEGSGDAEADVDEGDVVDADPEDYFSSAEGSEAEDDVSPVETYEYTLLPPLDDPKGLYRAAYPFEALTKNELQLVEGDLLEVSGRGQGDPGWVIARRMKFMNGRVERAGEVDGGGRVGLVPEGYLERIEVIGA